MKLKKIICNILNATDTNNQLNEKITFEDIQNNITGFHIVITNKVDKKFYCDFFFNTETEIYWSIDRKKTKTECINIEYNLRRCRLKIEPNNEFNLFIWTEKNNPFILLSISNKVIEIFEELDSLLIKDTMFDKDFTEIFNLTKKYHFDQYRKFLVLNLCNNINDKNEGFVKEMVDKILRHVREERYLEGDDEKFYSLVFKNLLEENCGSLDPFSNYREKIMNKLKINIPNLLSIFENNQISTKIITDRFKNGKIQIINKINFQEKEEKFNIFPKKEINKNFNYKTVNNIMFIITEYSRKTHFFEIENSIIIFKYKDIILQEIENTIEKIVNESSSQSYEILLYFDDIRLIKNFDKIIENLFHNYDYLFKIKIISKKGPSQKISEIQKLIILSNFINCSKNYVFLISIGSIFPKKYLQIVNNEKINDNTILIANGCNILNKLTGRIDWYEVNRNKLFNYFVECLFPIVPKNIFNKCNFTSPFFGQFEKFKDFKNFLLKNGTINEIKIIDNIPPNYLKDALHIFEI